MQFANVVYSKTLLTTSVTPANNLQENTVHYWRVKASNNCGEGPFSEIYTFTTMGTSPTPDFSMNASPSNLSVCSPEDAIFDVTLTAISGFTDPVTLSVSGIPVEMPADFDINPVVPSGSSELTIDSASSTGEVDYTVEILGVSSNITHSTFVTLHIASTAPDMAPTLVLPTDGMTDTELMPTLSWEGVTDASSYQLAVATDSGFNNVVYSAMVAQTSHSLPAPLNENTEYFWRVTPENVCGVGPVSTVFSFTTTEDGSPTATNFVYMPIIMEPN
jgi:hypothetical protein